MNGRVAPMHWDKIAFTIPTDCVLASIERHQEQRWGRGDMGDGQSGGKSQFRATLPRSWDDQDHNLFPNEHRQGCANGLNAADSRVSGVHAATGCGRLIHLVT